MGSSKFCTDFYPPLFRKRWQIYHSKADPYELSVAWTHMLTLPSWNTAELLILKNTLEYGLYTVQYTLTMWGQLIVPSS